MRAARAARFLVLIQPIGSQFSGVAVAVAMVVALGSLRCGDVNGKLFNAIFLT